MPDIVTLISCNILVECRTDGSLVEDTVGEFIIIVVENIVGILDGQGVGRYDLFVLEVLRIALLFRILSEANNTVDEEPDGSIFSLILLNLFDNEYFVLVSPPICLAGCIVRHHVKCFQRPFAMKINF